MIIIGCPVYERGWILDRWFDHIQALSLSEVQFVFAFTPSTDDTLDIIKKRTEKAHVITVTEGDHSTERNWGSESRIQTMAMLRNKLLEYVRTTDAAGYMSLDSDILVNSNYGWLLKAGYDYDAVGPLVYLGSGDITNGFTALRNGYMRRMKPYDCLQKVDVLCAAKLMSRTLFMDERVHYGYHSRGEDFYWSKTATDAGYKLAIDSSVKFKHVMRPDQLDWVDPRVGF